MASLVDSSQEQEAYTAALALLSQLQPNRAVTSLFTSPPPAFKTKDSKPAFDMNSLAIPEMLAWLSRAGYTPKSIAASGLKCVHVAGTKGKGSVSAMIASILAQYPQDGNSPIGLYTSPHVLSVRERIALNNAPISREKFTQNFHSLWDRFTAAAQHPTNVKEDVVLPTTHPFYFRFLTILAIHTFLAENVHSAVVECGIGGEYDATTALFHQSPDVVTASVVTQLGIDHVSMLGDTVEKIAWHKAGLLRALLAGAKGEDGKGMFTHAIFTRNEEEPAGGESRDLSIQIKAEKTIREVEPATATAVCDSVQKTVAHVRNIAAQAKQEGKPCQVLVTGSFHLVGALLKTIAPFES
ncbi:hypothetical protein N0V88_006531 [Collariella sp. IMI 366227]|nr:hypothetical protein N0V88_006531 [Collariella sp. IMI 366227]